MPHSKLIEETLERVLSRCDAGPALLSGAMRSAVFPGGARVRPALCIAVAQACGAEPRDAAAVAAAIELLHCASLVHDDLPCFDDADVRRGRPTVHAAYGQPLAVLAGDGLIVTAFEALSEAGPRLAALLPAVTRAVGVPNGIVAGQAWESEPRIDLRSYHRAKTGALFVAATTCGAICAGAEVGPWRTVGERLGEAYQIADDVLDYTADSAMLGKPANQDQRLDRPNAVSALGLQGAADQLRALIQDAAEAVPPCGGAATLELLIRAQYDRLASVFVDVAS
ncbi:MAG: polyprenyl synthetase family protein [Pseudomonadota bacterium]